MSFNDHFSKQADEYARSRPGYPAGLFDYLAAQSPGRALAWDVATGNGQAAHGLSGRFDMVVACDASAQQLERVRSAPGVRFVRALAEQAPLPDRSVDIVTVAQALHWFDLESFFREVRRVTRPGAILAAWCYDFFDSPGLELPTVDRLIALLTPYWPEQNRLVREGYAGVRFPFDELAPPSFEMRCRWDPATLCAYLRSWSATQRYLERHGTDPVAGVASSLPAEPIELVWRVYLRVCRVGVST